MSSLCMDCYLRGPWSCLYPKGLGPGVASCVNGRRVVTGPPSVSSGMPMSSAVLQEGLFVVCRSPWRWVLRQSPVPHTAALLSWGADRGRRCEVSAARAKHSNLGLDIRVLGGHGRGLS